MKHDLINLNWTMLERAKKCIRFFFSIFIVFTISILSLDNVSAQWKNGMEGVYVIGQPSLDKWHQGKVGRDVFNKTTGVAIDLQNNKIYVADYINNRVLRFAYPVTQNMPQAEIVFGQIDFDSKLPNMGSTPAANTLRSPYGVTVYNGTLWITDQSNNRVLRFDNAHLIKTNAPNADGVLGQPNFERSLSSSNQNGMFWPQGIAIDSSGNLFISQPGPDGILRYDDAQNKENGADADGLLGRPNFEKPLADLPASKELVSHGLGMAIDNDGRLFVADWGYNRVLWFNDAANKEIGASADGVLGQKDFVSTDTIVSQSGFYVPRGIAISPKGRLFVCDAFNNRVLIFNDAARKENGGPADYVIGQQDFITNQSHYTADRMKNPTGLAVTPDGYLFVAQYDYSRVTIFKGTDDSEVTSVSSYDETSVIKLYPIPATYFVDLSCSVKAGELEANFQLINLNGVVVQSQIIQFAGTGNNTKRIPLNESVTSGAYIYSLDFENSKYCGKVNVLK